MSVVLGAMTVRVLPALKDNYMYLLIDNTTREAAVVDPVEPKAVMEAVQQENVNLTKVLTTHHHREHSRGNSTLQFMKPNLEVYGGDSRVGALTHTCQHNDNFSLGHLNIQCIHIPSNTTTGHICYYVTSGSSQDKVVFTGDTLFLRGCESRILASLPDDTKVFGGHEYTLQNLRFGLYAEPYNESIKVKYKRAQKARANHVTTMPSTIGEEKETNHIIRTDPNTKRVVLNFDCNSQCVRPYSPTYSERF